MGMLHVCGNADVLALDIISYEDLLSEKPRALETLQEALYQKGIFGVSHIPGYREKVAEFVRAAQDFSALPEEIKEKYGQGEGEIFLGYERGKERFKRADGSWVVDDLKVSYYVLFPDVSGNKWPAEVGLKEPFLALSGTIAEVGRAVMQKVGLLNALTFEEVPNGIARMLHYRKSSEASMDNPFWCGAHLDHGPFTGLLPAFYFMDGVPVEEPIEAGLFVKARNEETFKKVVADGKEVLLFQVGEFGQLATNDAIRATKHYVHKAEGNIERYALAFFFDPSMDAPIHSFSELTQDERYGGKPGDPCTYRQWHEGSFHRYIVKEQQ
jgi:isopenicillin N synthase-like dioxygenase